MKAHKALIAALLLAILTMGVGCATHPTPVAAPAEEEANWKFHAIVDVDFVEQHLTIPMDENVMLIDARPKRAKYDQGHIPMAVSIPDTEFDKHIDRLPKNKDALLIYYCEGWKCKLSHKSAAKAEKMGYTNVKVFAEGYPKWMEIQGHYPSVAADWVKRQLDEKADMVLVDSRPRRAKYDKGHIPTAISISDTEFDQLKGDLPADKGKLLVFYCGGLDCKLSHKSAKKALDLGYTDVKVFSAGYPAWLAMQPKTPAAAPVAMKAGKEEGSIDIAAFREIVTQRPESVYLIDVRDADEFEKGSFKTAVNIPVDTLEAKIKTLPGDKPILFVCGTGARSGESYYMVQDLRPELKQVYYLDAELTIKKDGSFEIKKPG
jgi:rhodanese-related sulfurtransferase